MSSPKVDCLNECVQWILTTLNLWEYDLFLKLNFFLRRHIFRTIRIRKAKGLVNSCFERSKGFINFAKRNIDFSNYIDGLENQSQTIIKQEIQRMIAICTGRFKTRDDYLTLEEKKDIIKIEKQQNVWKQKYRLPHPRYEIPVFFYHCGLKIISKKVLKKIETKDFIDCGAFSGDSALIFEKEYHPRKIYAFEPEHNNFKLMSKTININNLKKVVPVNKALDSEKGTLNILNLGVKSHISVEGNQRVEAITIDDFVSEHNLSVGLIKMDIEGYELNALRGAEATIKQFQPVLLISIYHNPEQYFKTVGYIKSINPNYQIIIRKLHPYTLFLETNFIAW